MAILLPIAETSTAARRWEMAADPAVFPTDNPELSPWQAQQLLWNVYQEAGVKDIGGVVDPRSHYWGLPIPAMNNLLGKSYGDIAADSRNQHRCQAMGNLPNRKASIEYFELIEGKAGKNGKLDLGVSPIYKSALYAKYSRYIDQAIKNFDIDEPAKIASRLIQLLHWMDRQPQPQPDWLMLKKKPIEALLIQALGVQLEASSPTDLWCIGDVGHVNLQWAMPESGKTVTVEKIEIPALRKSIVQQLSLQYSGQLSISGVIDSTSKPYLPEWLRQVGTANAYRSEQLSGHILSELPISPAVKVSLNIDGLPLLLEVPVKKVWNDRLLGAQFSPVVLAPQVAVRFLRKNLLIHNAEKQDVVVEVKGLKSGRTDGVLKLAAPQGWTVLPEQVDFSIAQGESKRIRFTVQVDALQETIADLGIQVATGGLQFEQSHQCIDYPHIVKQQYFPNASLRVLCTTIANTAKRIAYVKAKEDKLPTALREFVAVVDELWVADLPTTDLSIYDAIVLGDRLYNVDTRIYEGHNNLLHYLENGGVVISQYNTNYDLDSATVGLLPVQVSNERITDEEAEVQFLDNRAAALIYPNRLSQSDFKGWIQDRAIFIPKQWDTAFTPLLSSNDKGQNAQQGLLLIAKQGKGFYVYTSLSLFRQLPYGVPGAYKLFANLLSLGSGSGSGSGSGLGLGLGSGSGLGSGK